jgi:hypothetical protein
MWKQKLPSTLVTLVLSASISVGMVRAENAVLEQAIKDYYAGDYQTAAGHLGEAESAEFNNAKLHYFLANSFVHLKQKDAAIREYRIAYALEPTGEVGELSKQALVLCGVETASTGKGALSNANGLGKSVIDDPLLKAAFARLQQSSDGIKQAASQDAQARASGLSKLSDVQEQMLRRNLQDMIDDIEHSHNRSRASSIEEARDEAQARFQSMQRSYESQKNGFVNAGRRRVSAIDETASNLQLLMNEPAKPGHMKLSPLGTNLYVRNYDQVPYSENNKAITETKAPQTTP